MSIKLDLQVEIELNQEEKEALQWMEKSLDAAVKVEEIPDVQVSVTIVNNKEIQQINKEYREIDQATDVLSFPLYEPDEDWMLEEGEDVVALGDIVISMERANEQAIEYGHSLNREVGFLAVHGFLHLLGYDHETSEEEQEMFGRQEEILDQIGLRR